MLNIGAAEVWGQEGGREGEGDQTLLYRHPPYPYQEWLACGEEEEKGTEGIGRRKEGKERERKQ